jgi:hypothetical protein
VDALQSPPKHNQPIPLKPYRRPLSFASRSFRAPFQLGVALVVASLLALAPLSAAAFGHHGEWIAITVALALEANVGATVRKASLRSFGTAVGGGLGTVVVALTAALSGGWSKRNVVSRVAVMTVLISVFGAAVQLARVRSPPSRDYAFAVCLVTLALTSLSSSTSASLRQALLAVGSRMAAIACGGGVAFCVSVLCFPEYAAHEASDTLGWLLRDTSQLLGAAVEAHLVADGATCGGLFQATHRDNHALEAKVTKSLEKLGTLLSQSGEERLLLAAMRGSASTAAGRGLERAGAACRTVFTGAVSLLHSAEAGLTLGGGAAHAHAVSLRAARSAMVDCFSRLAERAESPPGKAAAAAGAAAASSLSAFEAGVEALAGAVAAERPSDAECGSWGDARRSVQALGSLCFALGDAARQAREVLGSLGVAEEHFAEEKHEGLGRGGGGGGAMGAALHSAAAALDVLLGHPHFVHPTHRLMRAGRQETLARWHPPPAGKVAIPHAASEPSLRRK